MKISIITAVRNAALTIRDCIESVASQTHPVEHIIVDGASTDGTQDIIEEVVSRESRTESHESRVANKQSADADHESRITSHKTQMSNSLLSALGSPLRVVVSEPDNGIYDALNKGIRMATGDVIGFLHADDIYADKTVIEKVVKVMSQENCDSCYGDLVYVKEAGQGSGVRGQGSEASHDSRLTTDDSLPFTTHSLRFSVVRYWKSCPFSPDLLGKGWMPPHPTFFVKREVYRKLGVFDTSFRIAADYELMLRFLGRHRISTCYIPEVLIRMRIGGASNRSLPNILRKSAEDLRAMKMHDIGGLPTLLRKNLSKIPQFFKRQ